MQLWLLSVGQVVPLYSLLGQHSFVYNLVYLDSTGLQVMCLVS